MKEIIIICKPDENGVYSIDGRYINAKIFKEVGVANDSATDCPVCNAYQKKPIDGKCVVCGYDIARLDVKEFILKMKDKEHIEALKNKYMNKINPEVIAELKRMINECMAED